MREFLIEWYPYFIGVLVVALGLITTAIKRPEQIKQWLIFACAEAEAKLGSGTGKLKLRDVYNAFISKYPIISIFISFDKFSGWVDESLAELKKWIEENPNVANFFENKGE